MPPFGSAALANSFASTHTNTLIVTMSTTIVACDQMDDIFFT
jgi:hypothetical protein